MLPDTDIQRLRDAGRRPDSTCRRSAPARRRPLGGSFYVGPKEYHRLANPDVFKADQDKVMQFGFFKFFSELLLTLMTWIHSLRAQLGPGDRPARR